MKTPVSALLQSKGKDVVTIASSATVFEAIQHMSDKHVGALIVLNKNGTVAGLLSERDCFSKVILKEKPPRKSAVKDVMTKKAKLIIVSPDRSVEDCMEIMTESHIRHLPVMRGDTLLGVISMRDVVRFLVTEQDLMIKNLEKYIEGSL